MVDHMFQAARTGFVMRAAAQPSRHAHMGVLADLDEPAGTMAGLSAFPLDEGEAFGVELVDKESAHDEPAPLRPVPTADEPQLQAWLTRIVGQDEDALAELYRASVGRVYGLALRIVRDPACAEEVAEDTFWQVWRQAPRFDAQRGTALAWVMTIARSRALDALRTRNRAQAGTVSADAMGDALDGELAHGGEHPHGHQGDSPQDLLEAVQAHASLHGALSQLDPIPRQLVALAFFKGLTHEEIAGQTGLPLGTVKSHIRRALAALRKWLSPEGGLAEHADAA